MNNLIKHDTDSEGKEKEDVIVEEEHEINKDVLHRFVNLTSSCKAT